MKIRNMMVESFECVKINGILRNLNNDEMRIYKKVKENGKLFKADLEEFDQTVASSMVSKGLLRRVRAKQENGKKGRIYFITRGRNGKLSSKPLEEVAPPDREIESWIRKNKKAFKDRYGEDYGKFLYGKAWKKYNGKKPLKEGIEHQLNESLYIKRYDANECISKTYFPIEWIAPMGKETKYCAYFDDSEWVVATDEEISTDTYFNINSDKVKAGFFISNVSTGMVYKVSGIQEDTLRLSNPKNKEFKSGLHFKAFFEALLNRYLIIVDDSQPLNDMPENEPESSGEEFDESYLGESVLMETSFYEEYYGDIYDIIKQGRDEGKRPELIFRELAESGFWYHNYLYNHDRDYSSLVEEFENTIINVAMESGNFDVHRDGADLDTDATNDKIDEESYGYLWYTYGDDNFIKEKLENIIEYLTNQQHGEPAWSGDDEQITQPTQTNSQLTDDEMELVEEIRIAMENIDVSYESRNKIIDLLKKLAQKKSDNFIVDEYHEIIFYLRDKAWESGDFDVYEKEYDEVATREAIYNETTSDLVDSYVNRADVDEFLNSLMELCEQELDDGSDEEDEDESYGENEPEEDGSEWMEESYTPFDVNSLLNRKVIDNKDNKVGKVTSIGFHRVDGKKVDDIFITDLMSKEEIRLSKEEFLDNWNVLPYEKEIKKQDDSDDEEIYRLMRNIMLT